MCKDLYFHLFYKCSSHLRLHLMEGKNVSWMSVQTGSCVEIQVCLWLHFNMHETGWVTGDSHADWDEGLQRWQSAGPDHCEMLNPALSAMKLYVRMLRLLPHWERNIEHRWRDSPTVCVTRIPRVSSHVHTITLPHDILELIWFYHPLYSLRSFPEPGL